MDHGRYYFKNGVQRKNIVRDCGVDYTCLNLLYVYIYQSFNLICLAILIMEHKHCGNCIFSLAACLFVCLYVCKALFSISTAHNCASLSNR